MASTPTMSSYWRGLRDALPFLVVVGPFALLFGVAATEAGFSVIETLTFSMAVVAGAAQLTALQQMIADAPTIVVLASALAVNLRNAMYSASLTPWLGQAPLWQRAIASYVLVDQTYAMSVAEYEKHPDLPIGGRMAYFFGTATPIIPVWYGLTLVGAVLGDAIPEHIALDFALPIAFLAMIAPMLRTPAHLIAAFVAIGLSLALAGLPLNLGLFVAGVCGMVAGAEVERRSARQGGHQ